jgi:hypothetical protein
MALLGGAQPLPTTTHRLSICDDSLPMGRLEQRPRRTTLGVLRTMAVVLVILLIAYTSASDGVDYLHGFGKACLVVHHGSHFHIHCGAVSRPKS